MGLVVLCAGALATCTRDRDGDGGLPGIKADNHAWFPVAENAVHAVGRTADDGPIRCESCHTTQDTFSAFSCIGCHEHRESSTDAGPGMREVHAGNSGFTYDSPACLRCHPSGTADNAISREAHEPYFPIASGSAHQAEACSSCHVEPGNRQVVTCTVCHAHEVGQSLVDHGDMKANHGYTHDTARCLACHDRAQVPGAFDHEPIYKILPPSGAGQHSQLGCLGCHADKQARSASLDCTTCHRPVSSTDSREIHDRPYMDEVHGASTGAIPGYAWTRRSCIGCHTDGTAASARTSLDHVWFPVSAGKTHALTTNGGTFQCADCHAVPGDFTVATIACTTCHTTTTDGDAGAREVHGQPRLADVHSGVADYTWESARCVECHPNGEIAGPHLGFPIGTGAAHGAISCSECHTGSNRSDRTQLACVSCHRDQRNLNPTLGAIHNGIPPYLENSPACLGCHPNSEKAGVFSFPEHERHFPIASGQDHHQAASVYLSRVASSRNACTACHASRTDRTANTCKECHTEVSVPHGRVPSGDSIATNADCKACHAESDVPNLSAHSDFGFIHHSSTCRGCHGDLDACLSNPTCANYVGPEDNSINPHVRPARRADKPWAMDWNNYACLGCHKHNRAEEEGRHAGKSRNGFTFASYASPGCAKCH